MKPSPWTSSLLPDLPSLSPQNTKGRKILQAWISRKKLSSLVFVSRSYLPALHVDISTCLCSRENLSLVSFGVTFAFLLTLFIYSPAHNGHSASRIGQGMARETSSSWFEAQISRETANLEIQTPSSFLCKILNIYANSRWKHIFWFVFQ